MTGGCVTTSKVTEWLCWVFIFLSTLVTLLSWLLVPFSSPGSPFSSLFLPSGNKYLPPFHYVPCMIQVLQSSWTQWTTMPDLVILTSLTNYFVSVWGWGEVEIQLTENIGKCCWEVTSHKKGKLADEKLNRKMSFPAPDTILTTGFPGLSYKTQVCWSLRK